MNDLPENDDYNEYDVQEVAPSISRSILRTVVPYVVAWVIAVLAKIGFDADSEQVTLAVTPIIGTIYYALVRWLEENVDSRFGWLLGSATSPSY